MIEKFELKVTVHGVRQNATSCDPLMFYFPWLNLLLYAHFNNTMELHDLYLIVLSTRENMENCSLLAIIVAGIVK